MTRRLALGLVVLALLAGARVARAEEEDAQALARRVFDALPKQSFSAKVKLSSARFAPRELAMKRKFVGGAHASYLEIVAPETLVGIRFLFLERPDGQNEQFMKAAFSRSKLLVSDEIRRQPFLGSDFYVADLVLPRPEDYTYRYAGTENVLGRRCKFVEMTPKKPDEALYGKTILALDPRDLLILGRRFYDSEGRLQKVWTVDKVEKVEGIWTLRGQELSNVQEKTKSRLDVEEIDYDVELPDDMFTTKYLLR